MAVKVNQKDNAKDKGEQNKDAPKSNENTAEQANAQAQVDGKPAGQAEAGKEGGESGNGEGQPADEGVALPNSPTQEERARNEQLQEVGIDPANLSAADALASRLDGGNITLDTETKTRLEGAHPSNPVTEYEALKGHSPDEVGAIARDQAALEAAYEQANSETPNVMHDMGGDVKVVLASDLKRYNLGGKLYTDEEVYLVSDADAERLLSVEMDGVPVFKRHKEKAQGADRANRQVLPQRREVRREAGELPEDNKGRRAIHVGSDEEEQELFGNLESGDTDDEGNDKGVAV